MKNIVQVKESKIVVGRNSHTENGLLARHEVKAILPNCRKVQTISLMPVANGIALYPLFGYNGRAVVSLGAWETMIMDSPIVPDWISPTELTPEVKEWARNQARDICHCPATCNLENVCQQYLDSQKFDVLDWNLTRGPSRYRV
jgi:hypothetical protein